MSSIMTSTDEPVCVDAPLLMRIGEHLSECSAEDRKLVLQELFPQVVMETYGSSKRAPYQAFIEMLRSLSDGLVEFRALREVERSVLGDEYDKAAGPLSLTYLKARERRLAKRTDQ